MPGFRNWISVGRVLPNGLMGLSLGPNLIDSKPGNLKYNFRVFNFYLRRFSSQATPQGNSQQPGQIQTASSSPNFNYGYPTPGPQSPTPQEVMNHLFFLSKTGWKRVREEERFDHVIVGSSFAAYGFAHRILSRHPFAKILMLERGPFFLPEHFQNLPVSYQAVVGGLSETFPWTVSAKTIQGKYIKWQHGAVPFFGGRSLMWSGWCPRPMRDEMRDWPTETMDAAYRNYEEAERLLNVIPADQLDKGDKAPAEGLRPIFGVLQKELTERLRRNLKQIPSATRVMAAPLAVNATKERYNDFYKFATSGPLLDLIESQRILASSGKGAELKVATECVVQRILQQDGQATALATNRGVVPMNGANLILAMGALPATTLVLNSYPQAKHAGEKYTAHFVSSIIARVPRKDFEFANDLGEIEIAAIYLAGMDKNGKQYHIQLTALSDRDPLKNAETAARHMPDVVATATPQQLRESTDYVVFVCAVLGEIGEQNARNWVRRNPQDQDSTTNSMLQVIESETDSLTWETMDTGTFQALEKVLSPKGPSTVEYWHPNASGTGGSWQKGVRPSREQIRVPGLVHEGSTMHIGAEENAVVDLNYRLKGSTNVYVTGTSLWPTSGSWNPTLTLVALSQDLADRLTRVQASLNSAKDQPTTKPEELGPERKPLNLSNSNPPSLNASDGNNVDSRTNRFNDKQRK